MAATRLKALVWRLLGVDSQAVVVSFCSGPRELALRMVDEVRALVPDREHFAVAEYDVPGVTTIRPSEISAVLRRKRIGLAPTLMTGEGRHIRWLALRYAPLKVLAYNERLERHHLRLTTPLASALFLRGVPLDRIWLRLRWLMPWKRDRSTWPESHREIEGRAFREGRKRIGVLSPYLPFPLSHGGAVRIYNLLREGARDYDIVLFAFADSTAQAESSPLLEFCSRVVVFPQPRYREPRWSTLLPPEVHEFRSGYVDRVLREIRTRDRIDLLQVEYTWMASYGGDILVEHDVTFDLHAQVHARERSLTALLRWWRWFRYENAVAKRFRAVVVMSEKDASLLNSGNTHVIPNGVDLHRFRPDPECQGARILFVGSFAHFPNVVAYRWFVDHVWPEVLRQVPEARFVVVAGRNPELYMPDRTPIPGVDLHGFISDVRPFYAEANVVVVPTQVSAGTNLKVLEAMACERAVVSTTSGCGGLHVTHGTDVWIADEPAAFADAIVRLIRDYAARVQLARGGRALVQAEYGWDRLAARQRALWAQLLVVPGLRIRRGTRADAANLERIQTEAHGASQWDADAYFSFDVQVAELQGRVCGFLVSRTVAPDEAEVLNLAVAADARRQGVATALIQSVASPDVFLEVRESNTPAQSLYTKLGFVVVGKRVRYYEDPVEDALVMRRSSAQDRVH